ncbi:MAG: hypothetical protein J6V74_08290 [Bacteroidales bacterium]|nr:hypothetical protein [Bacteroidales bacterium]
MKKIIVLIASCLCVVAAHAQITANDNVRAPEELEVGNPLGTIAVEEAFTEDSLNCEFTCVVIPESNAIRLTATNPKGMYLVFRRGYTKLYTRDFDDNVIFLDIKGTFDGKYIIDIFDQDKIRVKSYVIERKL